jgi:hypothetical protein
MSTRTSSTAAAAPPSVVAKGREYRSAAQLKGRGKGKDKGAAKKAAARRAKRSAGTNSALSTAAKRRGKTRREASTKRPQTRVAAKRARATVDPTTTLREPPAKLKRSTKGVAATAAAVEPAAKPSAPATTQATEQAKDGPRTADATPQPVPSSLLRRYLPLPSSSSDPAWNTSDAAVFATFLAQVQVCFVRSCCQLLAKLTTATSTAFLHAAALGEAALASPVNGEGNDSTANPLRSTPLGDADQLVDRQEQAYRTLRATIAASCTLGHRSCQVLWGPRGSGKHRILRLLAQEVRRTPNTFVMELHGRLLRDDEAALGVIAQQLFTFLQSPQSRQLRERHYLLRTGSFGFGQLFHFERRMQKAAAAAASTGDGDASEPHRRVAAAAGVREGNSVGAVQRRAPGKAGARRRGTQTSTHSGGSSSSADVESAEEEEEVVSSDEDGAGGGAEMMITSTTTYLTGGAASALPHLQRALLLLKSLGCSVVVCIRDIDIFGIRCDQLLYVLSGLMHDSEGSSSSNGGTGGGLSLVLASAAPDIRQLEKRLSSRLTCETRYVPLLPWSLTGLLAATLHVAAQSASFQLEQRELTTERVELLSALRDGATELRCLRENLPRRGAAKKAGEAAMQNVQDSMARLEGRLHTVEASLRDVRAQRRHFLGFLDVDGAVLSSGRASQLTSMSSSSRWPPADGSGAAASALGHADVSGWRSVETQHPSPTTASSTPASTSVGFVTPRSWTVAGLHSKPGLTLEVLCVLCEELLRQLRMAAASARTTTGTPSFQARGSAPPSLVQRAVSLSVGVDLESGTSATVLTALTNILCKAASGEVDLVGSGGRRLLLRWLRARLQHEVIPPPPTDDQMAVGMAHVTGSASCPPGLPAKIATCWKESAQALALPLPVVSTTTTAAIMHNAGNGLSSSNTAVLKPHCSVASPVSASADGTGGESLPKSFFAATAAAASEMFAFHRSPSALMLPPLSLLPPHLFDLFAEGQLVGMGYGSKEMMLVLLYMHLHHTTGVRQRTVADLLEDVSSSLGTRAAAALDRAAFRVAIRLLCRWRLLTVVEQHSQTVQLCGSDARLRDFLATVLSKQPVWCEAELGLDAREMMRFRSLL